MTVMAVVRKRYNTVNKVVIMRVHNKRYKIQLQRVDKVFLGMITKRAAH
jgi:hypothetical protein